MLCVDNVQMVLSVFQSALPLLYSAQPMFSTSQKRVPFTIRHRFHHSNISIHFSTATSSIDFSQNNFSCVAETSCSRIAMRLVRSQRAKGFVCSLHCSANPYSALPVPSLAKQRLSLNFRIPFHNSNVFHSFPRSSVFHSCFREQFVISCIILLYCIGEVYIF